MREILFRGKRLDNGELAYGYVLIDNAPCALKSDGKCKCAHDGSCTAIYAWNDYLHEYEELEVDAKTVGQYTGLKDKNGKRIFDGDIVKLHYFFENYNPSTLGAFEDENEIVAKITFGELGLFFEGKRESGYLLNYLEEPSEELEVIGNIHDNTELLEATK